MQVHTLSLIAARQRRGMSQAELARRAQTSRSYICRLEGGTSPGTVQVLDRIASALGVKSIDITVEDGIYRASRQRAAA